MENENELTGLELLRAAEEEWANAAVAAQNAWRESAPMPDLDKMPVEEALTAAEKCLDRRDEWLASEVGQAMQRASREAWKKVEERRQGVPEIRTWLAIQKAMFEGEGAKKAIEGSREVKEAEGALGAEPSEEALTKAVLAALDAVRKAGAAEVPTEAWLPKEYPGVMVADVLRS